MGHFYLNPRNGATMVVFFCCLTFKINVAFGIVLVDFIGLDDDDALDLVETSV